MRSVTGLLVISIATALVPVAPARLMAAAALRTPMAAGSAGHRLAPAGASGAQGVEKLREPLPLDVAVSMRSHNGRSPIDVSPDGAWVAHTIATDETVERASDRFAATGFPFAEGDSRMEATVTNTRTGESIRLGGAHSSSWGAAWSPDGERVAFYSDEGGEAGLWVWDLAQRSATRVGSVIARPFFGFELPAWSPDGNRILVKVLPAGMSVAQANARAALSLSASPELAEPEPGEPAVRVRRVVPTPETDEASTTMPVDETPSRRPPTGDVSMLNVDLALIDLAGGGVTRLVEDTAVRAYAFAPDGERIAYTVLKGYEPASQQPDYDLVVIDRDGGSRRTLATNLRLAYGIEWSWSPGGERIAWIPSGQSAQRAAAEGDPERVVVASVADGALHSIGFAEAPTLDPGDGELRPLWDAAGEHLYAVGDGDLWQVTLSDVESVGGGALRRLAGLDGWGIRSLVAGPYEGTVWTDPGSGSLWATARRSDGSESAILAFAVAGGAAREMLVERKTYGGIFNLDASTASGEIAFISTDQQHPYDIWMLDTRDGDARPASHINRDLERYELGQARILTWHDLDGAPLAGALLLPPGYRDGERLPLVVWVYGGSLGSTYVNRFGFWGDIPTFNMHVLATRGYAVLFPDAPLNVGSPMSDLMRTVMPGVNAAVEQGFADPERLAIMGQSYGSYNTLAIITQTQRFKAAVITAAVLHPDLFADYLGSTGYYEQGQGNMGGSIWEVPQRYFDNSPLFHFDQISTPLLIGQGSEDGDLVPSQAIFNALERLDKAVEYRVYEGESHVITQRANVLDFWRRRLEFLADNLGLEVDEQGAVTGHRR